MDTPIEQDVYWYKKFEDILRNQQHSINGMDDTTVTATASECLRQLQHLRMGGRSAPLYVLAILLWHAHDRWPRIPFDVEERLSLAFRISLDPSFVQPEWGIVLMGVLINRYAKRLPTENDVKDEVLCQCRQNLGHLAECSAATNVVQGATAKLLECWSGDFPKGVDPVRHICLESWPDTSDIQDFPKDKLDEIIREMNEKLPATLTEDDRRHYRLHLERKGIWSTLESVSLENK